MCQLKCVGKTACKDPVSTDHSRAGFRVSEMLTAFWTASTPLWQAKSYYPTWVSPVALLKPSNMLSFKCVCVCVCVCVRVWRQAERGRESSSRFTVSVSSCVCQCWPEAFQCYPVCVIIHHTLLSSQFLLSSSSSFSKAQRNQQSYYLWHSVWIGRI